MPRSSLRSLLAAGLAVGLAAALPVPRAAAADDAVVVARVDAPLTVTGLMTNARVDPLGIPGEPPALSWHSTSASRGMVQTAYQVRVASSEGALAAADVWDSGKVASARQVDVAYEGPSLRSATRYVWQVRVWDGDDRVSAWSDPASFETGLLAASDWADAEWIGNAPGTELARWTDYTAEFDFTLDNLAFGTFVRAVNPANGYMWQLSVADGTPRLRPHVRTNGSYALLDNKDISSFITAEQLRTGRHTMAVTFDGTTVTTRLDGVVIDTRTHAAHARGFVGFRADLATEGVERSTVHDVRVTAEDGTTLLDTDFATQGNPFSGGTLVDGALRIEGRADVLWRSPDDNLPVLRTGFDTAAGKTVTRARVYATARGIYELRLNGEEVGDQHLAPGWTDYLDRFQHQTYDVTGLVDAGANVLGAELGSGWWAGRIAHLPAGQYGTDISVLARLRIDYADGTSQWVDTDDSTWTAATGPYTAADLIDGESYDARAARDGWDLPAYDDSGWTAAVTRPAPPAPVVPQPDEPVRTSEELATVARTEPAPGRWTYDLGQNMVGVARMTLSGQAGQTVTIRYGEELNPDGTLYTANMRSAKVTDRYTFATTGTVTYEPRFTQHGFRYLEILGTSTPPAATDVTGVVWGSDLRSTGDLDTSDPMLDQLVSNISWGQRGNFLSVPTDTPARDERLGWAGDINVFVPTASYLTDTRAFLSKWMMDMRDTQDANGDYQGVAPTPPGFKVGTGTGWSDAGITVPYAHWQSYGDISTARRYWADMKRFHGLLRTSAGADLLEQGRNTWGDWLHLDDPTPGPVLGTASYAHTTRLMAEMAAALGDDAYAAELRQLDEDVRAAFAAAYINPDGTVLGGSQTGYAIALGMDLVPDEMIESVGAKYVAELAAADNHLTTGFLGTPWLLPALSVIGRDDLAHTMLGHKDYPSWGYEIENGATTMWERWNSIMPDGSFGDVNMNSFNHYAYGAVGDWMYQKIGGISAAEPGYKKIRVAPSPGGGLTSGAGRLESVYGTIATDWQLEGDDLSLAVEVPVGTTADVVLPADNTYAVLEGGALLDGVDGVQEVVDNGETVTVTVGSGRYAFDVVAGNAGLGALLETLDALAAQVDDLAGAGDLDATERGELDGGIADLRDLVGDALLASVDGDDAAATTALQDALDRVRELRTWLAGSSVDVPVRTVLDGSLATVEAGIVRALTSALGVSVALPPVDGAVLPGATVSGTVEVTNDSDSPLTDISGTVEVEDLGTATVAPATVAAGQSAQLPAGLDVPGDAVPGSYDADLSLTYTLGGETHTVTATTADWAEVTSGLTVGTLTTAPVTSDPVERLVVRVPVSNTGTAPVRAHADLSLPAGWRSVPSADTLVPAGGEGVLEVPVTVPLSAIAGPVPVGVEVVRGADTLVTAQRSVAFDLPRPPTAAVLDHVDFGNPTSETAHAVQGSASSGTNTEAGLTRRYSHKNTPGSWFSAEVTVPQGRPFLLRNVETYDGPFTKKYDVFVDDVLVRTQLVPRTETGVGIKVYDALVDHPSLAGNDGKVRIKFQYPVDADAFYDPSIADLWVMAVPADTQAPDVSAVVTRGRTGSAGWYRSSVDVAVRAADNRDATPVVQTGTDAGWDAYVGPVTLTGEGRRSLTYRATDAAGGRTTRTLEVDIDTVAPATEVSVTRGSGVEELDRASLTFAATDATSGVGSTTYRVDGGAWTTYDGQPVLVQGFGDHVVEYASVDVAGNPEPVQLATVSLADVDAVSAVLAPQVSGPVRLGGRLRATAGSWNTTGLTFTYEWLRNGRPVAGATASSYTIGAADVGRRLSVRVTATKSGLEPGAATSAQTAPVAKASSRTQVAVSRTQVRAGSKVKVTATVKTPGVAVSGKVRVLVDGKAVRTLTLERGKASTKVVVRKGKHRVQVRYLGSTTAAPSSSPTRVVRGR